MPDHNMYNPPGSRGSSIGNSAKNMVFGDGFAGRPVRGMEKDFGKRVVTGYGMYEQLPPQTGTPAK